jgi:hypothetical protein
MIIKTIPSSPGYSVSEYGDVFSHTVVVRGKGHKAGFSSIIDYSVYKKLRPCDNGHGYLIVHFHNKYIKKHRTVHSLVAEAFIGERPDGLMIRHIDDNPKNNHYSNLCYGTALDNMKDRIRNSGTFGGEKNWYAKLTNEQVKEIRSKALNGVSHVEIAREYGVNPSNVSHITRYKTFKTV